MASTLSHSVIDTRDIPWSCSSIARPKEAECSPLMVAHIVAVICRRMAITCSSWPGTTRFRVTRRITRDSIADRNAGSITGSVCGPRPADLGGAPRRAPIRRLRQHRRPLMRGSATSLATARTRAIEADEARGREALLLVGAVVHGEAQHRVGELEAHLRRRAKLGHDLDGSVLRTEDEGQ